MMHKDNSMLETKPLEINSKNTVASEKESYETPALTIVKFMFENDITWGSQTSSHEGDNEGENDGTIEWYLYL